MNICQNTLKISTKARNLEFTTMKWTNSRTWPVSKDGEEDVCIVNECTDDTRIKFVKNVKKRIIDVYKSGCT